METSYILADSDFFIARLEKNDSHHARANALFQKLKHNQHILVTTSFVRVEAATTISCKFGQSLAKEFLAKTSIFSKLPVSDEIIQQATHLFMEQSERCSSMVDCLNVCVVRHYKLPAILSFDSFYGEHHVSYYQEV